MRIRTILFLLLSSHAAVFAGPRASGSYTISAETADAGGKRAASANYTNNGSLGGVVGISSVTTPAATARHGYIGQLYEVTALQLAATPTSLNEGSTRQLSARQLLDDLTVLDVPATSITWSILSGPLGSISTSGLATAGAVYESAPAIAEGSYAGNIGTLHLTVLNVNTDDFGTYAEDGIDDAWQQLYFGLGNPNAAPLLDPDGDGQNNLFEFTAGIVPTDATSKFICRVEPIPGQPLQKSIVFSPRFASRTYSILTSTSLQNESWIMLTGSTFSDNGNERTITDTNATGPVKFYQVRISKL